MPLIKIHKALILIVLFFALPPFATAGETPDVGKVVRQFQVGLVTVMQDSESLGVKGRYERLRQIIGKAFHARMMVRIATGQYWNASTPDQKDALAHAFSHMSAATLASLIDGYSGERFEFLGDQEGPQGTRIVSTQLITSENATHQIRYVARRFGDGWRLIDVIVDAGISELRVRMSEYRKTLQDSGVDGLINQLESKGNELMASAN